MPDITMCATEDCSRRHECYRATATPSDWQSVSAFKVVDGVCANFWPNDKKATRD